MTNADIKKNVGHLRAEIDALLAAGDRESLMKAIAILGGVWPTLIRNDDGLRYVFYLQQIWMDEMARGEQSVFADIHSVSEGFEKFRMVRHCFFRLENDFPDELCLEALQNIAALNLSQTAFRRMLEQEIEDPAKVTARIASLTSSALQ
jgi:hypothetical protein